MSRMMLSLLLLTAPISHTLGVTDAETEIQLLIHAVRESGCVLIAMARCTRLKGQPST